MADVFISYKTEEFDEANWVKTTLETNGISCWMAPLSIPGGSSYAVEIPQAIRAAKVFVLILSEKSQLSKWVPRELDQAINSEKMILPFVLEDCPLKDDFNFYLSNVQRYAAYENKAQAIEKMITRIKAVIGTESTENNSAISQAKTSESTDTVGSPFEKEETPDNIKNNSESKEDDAIGIPNDEISLKMSNPEKVRSTKNNNRLPKAIVRHGVKKRIIFAAIAAIFTVAVLLSVVFNIMGHVTIAGQRYDKSVGFISLKDTELTYADLKNLTECKKLGTLTLENCRFPLEKLEILFESVDFKLELSNCGITDDILAQVNFEEVNIKSLKLDDNELLTELTPLASLSGQLESLSFNRCSVSDISFLKDFTQIKHLEFASNKVSDISFLSDCTSVTELYISDNEIETISSLSSCKSISEISVDNNKLTSLEGLENSISLKKIKAENNKIENIDGLINATLLTEVNLSGNSVSDMSFLEKSKENLRRLYIAENEISDISFLEKCTVINELDISGNGIVSVEPLRNLKGLTFLNASNNSIDNISPLANLKNLNFLNLSNNKIKSTVSVNFSEESSYVTLDLSHNEITDLVIPTKVSYKYLAFYGNSISSLPYLESVSGSEIVFEYSPDIDFELLKKTSFNSYRIFDCPLDCQVKISETLGEYRTTFTNEEDYLKS